MKHNHCLLALALLAFTAATPVSFASTTNGPTLRGEIADRRSHPRNIQVKEGDPLPATSSRPTGVEAAALPPLPPDVTELRFGEFYKPIGARGIEFTDKLRNLDGRRVRIMGYMVRQTQPVPWQFLLAPVPLTLHEREYGFAEDMPATLLHVTVERNLTPILPHTPGPLLLTGTLGVGNREEPDGRVSSVRLALDPPTPDQRKILSALAGGSKPISTNAPVSPPESRRAGEFQR